MSIWWSAHHLRCQANFDGVNKFIANYGCFFNFTQPTAMGVGAGLTEIEMLNGSVVDVGGGTPTTGGAINGTFRMRAGSVFRLDDASQLQGTGNIFADPGAIFMLRSQANILMNGAVSAVSTQVTGNGVPGAGLTNAKGAIFRLKSATSTSSMPAPPIRAFSASSAATAPKAC
jgi:hypothetical protein